MSAECLPYHQNAASDLPARERVVRSAHWRAAHVFDTGLPGWLVLIAGRHITSLDELRPEEASELG